MLQAYKALGIPSLCGRWLHQEQASGIRAYLGVWSEATPFCYTDCPQVPQAAGGHTGQSVSTWPSGDLSLFCSQTCPHSKDPVWSQVFSFFVHSVAAEQLCLKVCLEWGSADTWETAGPRTAESFLCTLGSSGSQPHSAWEGMRPHKPSVP